MNIEDLQQHMSDKKNIIKTMRERACSLARKIPVKDDAKMGDLIRFFTTKGDISVKHLCAKTVYGLDFKSVSYYVGENGNLKVKWEIDTDEPSFYLSSDKLVKDVLHQEYKGKSGPFVFHTEVLWDLMAFLLIFTDSKNSEEFKTIVKFHELYVALGELANKELTEIDDNLLGDKQVSVNNYLPLVSEVLNKISKLCVETKFTKNEEK